jgi:hypothetical protein
MIIQIIKYVFVSIRICTLRIVIKVVSDKLMGYVSLWLSL